jgi:hypothetical protein
MKNIVENVDHVLLLQSTFVKGLKVWIIMLTSFLEYDESGLIEVYERCQMSTTIIRLKIIIVCRNCKDIMFLQYILKCLNVL